MRNTSGDPAKAFDAPEATEAENRKDTCVRATASVSSQNEGSSNCFSSRVLVVLRLYDGAERKWGLERNSIVMLPSPVHF